MRHLFRFENHHQPVVSGTAFSLRLIRSAVWGLAFIVAGLAIGMAGYIYFEGMTAVDAFVNAAMILSGMGPLSPLLTEAGKIFAGIYAIACGLLFIAVAGLMLAPVYHRVLHNFHVED
jgi:hypothetical protein